MSLLLFICFVCFAVAASVLAKKLTVPAALTGGLLAVLIFFGQGWTGIALMGSFFVLGTLATSWKKKRKEDLKLAQENEGRRNVGQVLANGGAAALIAISSLLFPQHANLFLLMTAAAFSSATADTVSSELGSVYGRKFYDVLTFKKGRRGDDGVISVEGCLAGLLGSIIITVVYAASKGFSSACWWIIVCGTVGNLADSYLGATLERKGIIGNDAVNFFNTVLAALLMLLLQTR